MVAAPKKTAASTGAEQTETAKHNTRIWDALCKTDPAATKQFNRSGGFKGTAIKPIWSALRMTEHFGPCGLGWGMEKPEFITERTADEVFVFCTVGLWYIEGQARGLVYGVGGDQVSTKGQSGIRTSDEAFKKSYTDALSNAMKQIGVAADVHMGLFDDSKYVSDIGEVYAEAKRTQDAETHQLAPRQPTKPAPPSINLDVDESTMILIEQSIERAASNKDLDAIWFARKDTDIAGLAEKFPQFHTQLMAAFKKRRSELKAKEAA